MEYVSSRRTTISSPLAGAVLLVSLIVLLALANGIAQSATRTSGSGFGAEINGAMAGSAALSAGSATPAIARHGALSGVAGSVSASRIEISPNDDSVIGVASASGINLLGGRIVAGNVSVNAIASAAEPTGIAGFAASGVTVDGQPVDAAVGSSIEVAGAGRLIFGEQVAGVGNVRVNALRLEITDAASGLPVGTVAVVGHLELSATEIPEPVPESGPSPDPGLPADSPVTDDAASEKAPPGPQDEIATPGAQPADPLPEPELVPSPEDFAPLPVESQGSAAAVGLPRRPAPRVVDLPSGTDYVFPVVSAFSYIDDYGAPRAVTGWHHGNDIFAPTGTPLVAVTSGVLSKVGVNTLGGNRLWLTDDRGNEFYYAHLSAYAPGVFSGARVRAGQVIGFVGNSGQAITTPPHLHFEIHPGGLDSVNPYPYLLAWERGGSVALAFKAATVAEGEVPAAGALLVDVSPAQEQLPEDDSGIARAVG